MTRFQPPPFRSLRDLVLKELQSEKSILVWDDDRIFTEDLLTGVLASEAYVLDRPAQEYLAGLSSDLDQDDYFRAVCNIRLPFEVMWIESVFDDQDEDQSIYDVTYGALVREVEDGVEVMHAVVVHDEKPWRPIYSGTQVRFCRDGDVICTKTPISRLYDRMAEASGYDVGELLNGDVDKALRLAGLLAGLTAILDRPRIEGRQTVLEREAPRGLRKAESKSYERAGRAAPRVEPGLIRLSKGFGIARDGRHETDSRTDSGTGRKGPAAHWVRGHLFLARNGRLTWRRPHVRGDGMAGARVHHVTE